MGQRPAGRARSLCDQRHTGPQEGTIVSDLEGTAAISGSIAGLPFVVSGASGAGRVLIEARDPDGALLISDLVGPYQSFRYPPGEDLLEFVLVSVEHPEQIPQPGGEVIFVLIAAASPENRDEIIITGLGVDPHSMDDLSRLDSGRADSCTNLELPVTLLRAGVMRCTFSLSMTGGVGDVLEIRAKRMTDASVDPWAGPGTGR